MPTSEKRVYEVLRHLPDEFVVFHSVRWSKRQAYRRTLWKENDFVILNPKLGGLVLEVKGGPIRYQDGVFYQKNRQEGKEYTLTAKQHNDPLTQAKDGMFHYQAELDLLEQHIPYQQKRLKDLFPIEVAVWFTDVERRDFAVFPEEYRGIGAALLSAEDFSDGTRAIQKAFRFWNANKKYVLGVSAAIFQKIVSSIAHDFSLVERPAVRREAIKREFLQLTQEQYSLLDYLGEQRKATIQGVAGTGKTLLACEAVRRFAAEGKRVLYLCFNKYLYHDIKRRYHWEGATYLNLHALLYRYIKPENRAFEEWRTAEGRAQALQRIDPDYLPFDDIVMDEAQDFSDEEIQYFQMLADLHEGRFFIFYDKNQMLMAETMPQWIEQAECRLVLTKNCRNTQAIARTAYHVMDIELNQRTVQVAGRTTECCFVDSDHDPLQELAKVIASLMKEEYRPSAITILSMKGTGRSFLDGTHHLGKYVLRTQDLDEMAEEGERRGENSIFFTTAMKFKGMESDVVIVTDIDAACFFDEKMKRRFYVACSRARYRLILFFVGGESALQEIRQAIGYANMSGKGAFLRRTASIERKLG